MVAAHLNRIATAVPPYDGHDAFLAFARSLLREDRERAVFDRLAGRSQISHRYSFFIPSRDPGGSSIDEGRVYVRDRFPSTGERMALYEKHAPGLAVAAVEKLELGADAATISHVVVTSCTGMMAPGVEVDLIERFGIPSSIERTNIGFMGCYAAMNALKLARHVVRSEPDARVLVVNLELCSLHLHQATSLEQLLSFLVFGDGCAASVVSADRVGVELEAFRAVTVPDTKSLITWKVRDQGFDMFLSGRVPSAIAHGLSAAKHAILNGQPTAAMAHWAVHPGGRSILDAVEKGLELDPAALAPSRAVLDDFGNMSSATIMFVLQSILESAKEGERGCAMSFGPGLTAETMTFRKAAA